MDPLPLYIVLLTALAAILPALIYRPALVLAASGCIYAAAAAKHWNFSAQPSGVWFFNPLAWQFIFFLGALCAIHREKLALAVNRCSSRTRKRILMIMLLLLSAAAVVALSWNWPEWHDRWMPPTIAHWLYPIDKTNLAPVRLLHFLMLAACVALLLPRGNWLNSRIARAIQLMGRHSLVVFCLGVLLAPIADGINTLWNDAALMQTITSIAGCTIMWLAAFLPEWFKQQSNERQARRYAAAERARLLG
jgi:hypothetical protein